MTLLYIVGPGSKHGNVELRWSLRSVAKFARGITRVIVAGSPPSWLAGGVERFPFQQTLGRTNRNIPDTALAAIETLGLSGDICLAYDDCILTRATDFRDLPLLCRSWSLPKTSDGGNNYFKALVETRAFLLANGLPALDFDQHAFKVFSGDSITRHRELVRKSIDESVFGVTADCLFCNLTLFDEPTRRVAFRRDNKFRRAAEIHAADWCLSFSDAAFDDADFIAAMERRYGTPCEYERS